MGAQGSSELLHGTTDEDIINAHKVHQQKNQGGAPVGGAPFVSPTASPKNAKGAKPVLTAGGAAPGPGSGSGSGSGSGGGSSAADARLANLKRLSSKSGGLPLGSPPPSTTTKQPATSPKSTSGSGSGLPFVPPVRGRRSRGRSINVTQIQQVRRSIEEFTSTLDFLSQFNLITGHLSHEEEKVPPSSSPSSSSLAQDGTASLSRSSSCSSITSSEKSGGLDGATPTSASPSLSPSLLSSDSLAAAAAAKEQKRKVKREKVVEEIIASEQLYYKFLQIMIDHFIRPMREKKLLTEDQVNVMFSNIEQIAPHHEVLAAELQKCVNVSSVFQQYANYLRVYVNYVNNYEAACDLVASKKRDKAFQLFLEEKRQSPECGGLDLMSFLIMPIQRIPRYRLLLTELKKHTTDSDAEHAALDDALEKIKVIANFVNEAKRAAENRSRIIEIQNKVKGEFDNLLTPGRVLLFAGPVLIKKRSSKPGYLFLFNDLLIWTSPKPEHTFLGVLNLATAETKMFEHKTKIGFVVSSPTLKDELIIVLRSNAERKTWLMQFDKAFSSCKFHLLATRDRQNSRRRLSAKKGSFSLPPPP